MEFLTPDGYNKPMLPNIKKIEDYYDTVDLSVYHDRTSVHSDTRRVDALMELFSDDTVYERQNHEPFSGKEAIRNFFRSQRALVGTHTLLQVKEESGIALDGHTLPDSVSAFPDDCTTVVVHGIFNGLLLLNAEQEGTRKVTSDRTVNLKFTDYWVMHEGKAMYRYSKITPMRFVAQKPKGVEKF